MKISEITTEDVIKYLRIEAGEETFVDALISAAKQFIVSCTGKTLDELNDYEDLTIVLYILCAEMYDNRRMTAESEKINPIVQHILNFNCNNR